MHAPQKCEGILPGGRLFFEPRFTCVDSLASFSEKVVKFTTDSGKTWNFALLGEPLYGVSGTEIILKGFPIYLVTLDWMGRKVSVDQLLTDDTFEQANSGPWFLGSQPLWFETASYDDYKGLDFSKHGKLDESYASRTGKFPDFPPGPISEAPFTLVRSDQAGRSVRISLLFSERFQPVEPTYPKPSHIERPGGKATWKVVTQKDNTLDVETTNGTHEKVKLIWWEAQRKAPLVPVETNNTARIRRDEVRDFLSRVLTQRGVKEAEQAAFVKYWEAVLCKQAKDSDSPYLLVQLASKEDVDRLLPGMQVSADDNGDAYELNRFYFRFVPTADAAAGVDPDTYLEALDSSALASNTVIDLGGEIVTADGKAAGPASDVDFNQKFIDQHIKV